MKLNVLLEGGQHGGGDDGHSRGVQGAAGSGSRPRWCCQGAALTAQQGDSATTSWV